MYMLLKILKDMNQNVNSGYFLTVRLHFIFFLCISTFFIVSTMDMHNSE